MEEEKSLELVCGKCGERGKHRLCGKCKMVHYCSVKCQREAWPEHKKTCKPYELEKMDKKMEAVCRTGLAGHTLSSEMDRALWKRAEKTGAYQDTTVILGRDVRFGMTDAGYWLQVKNEARIELGRMTKMVDIAAAVDKVMTERNIAIKGRDAYLKLMRAVARSMGNPKPEDLLK